MQSMTTKEVQQAALAPFLWRQRVVKGVIGDMDEFYQAIDISPARWVAPKPLLNQQDYRTGDVFVVPGGRFVIALDMSKAEIYVYHLGSLQSPDQPTGTRIASVPLSVRLPQWTFCVVPMGEEKLRSVVVMSGGSETM